MKVKEGSLMAGRMGPAAGVRMGMLGAVVVLAMALAACSAEDGYADLADFVTEVKARKAGRIPPLPEVVTYESYTYDKAGLIDPFKAEEEEVDTARGGDTGLRPDMDRNREPLESFPLDSLKFVGHMEQEGSGWAVISAPDGLVYKVEQGNYLGQSYGRILSISESRINLREIIPNGLGGWIERDATLTLVE